LIVNKNHLPAGDDFFVLQSLMLKNIQIGLYMNT